MGPNRGLIERLLKQLTRCLPQASSKKNKKKGRKGSSGKPQSRTFRDSLAHISIRKWQHRHPYQQV